MAYVELSYVVCTWRGLVAMVPESGCALWDRPEATLKNNSVSGRAPGGVYFMDLPGRFFCFFLFFFNFQYFIHNDFHYFIKNDP